MKEEDIIRKKCGTNNPFTTPEGYFDNFTERLMAKLPEKDFHSSTPINKKTTKFKSLHRIIGYAAAAAVCGIMIFSAVYITNNKSNSTSEVYTSSELTKEDASDLYMNEALDYAMVSNHEITMYLTEAY